ALLAVPAARAEPWLDFAQIDGSSSSGTLVLVHALPSAAADAPAPLLTATATGWSDGQSVAVGAVYRWTLAAGDGHALRAGIGAGIDHYRSRADADPAEDTGASLRAQAEADGALGAATRYYLLAQGTSFRDGWFATAQLSLGGGGVELSRYGDRDYHSTTAVVRLPLGAPGWTLRLGAVRDDDGSRAVVGIGWNGF
ncbi:MAG TPA: hypothetical protein VLM87_14405, partial [Rubrivivax sp.]|nr:hypothetical protein [Rubrivivax sp.]